jgi:hypothetical protein
LLGSADLQSLADLANSFEVVRGMRPVAFTTQAALFLAVTTALPIAPLILAVLPLHELLIRSLKAVIHLE